jgi:anthranilate synthase component 1
MTRLKVQTKEEFADLDTPVSAYLKLCHGVPDSILLESAEPHEVVGRSSILAWDPLATLELWPDRSVVRRGAVEETGPAEDFFPMARRLLQELADPARPDFPSLNSLMGYVGYDAVRLLERLGRPKPSGSPTARLIYPSRWLVFDHLRRVMTLVALGESEAEGRRKIEDMARRLAGPPPRLNGGGRAELAPPPRERFMAAVERAKEDIRAGEIFQVVLADRFEGPCDVDPLAVYRVLRVKSPSPYMFFLDFGGLKLAGASPETLVKVQDGAVLLRPIAGTRGRSADPTQDARLEAELLASEKERAEHVMLVDLARNDAGRVAEYGSIKVAPFLSVERFSHVRHLVSQVSGRLRPECDPLDAFLAGFPAGTVSGAPKIRAMQIIDELESQPRGVYAGAVGYLGLDGRLDAGIAIRLIVFKDGRAQVPVGAGIVADSEPAMEYQEILDKAAQSLAALRLAGKEGT